MAANPYEINYDDKRLTNIKAEEKAELNEDEELFGGMINNSDKYYNDLMNQSKDWADKQAQIQNEQTDFAIQKIEQQKEQAEQDYIKEQAGAYADWQKESDKYGVNAEIRAQNGLMSATGYNASVQANLYNTYQNRVATARETFARAEMNYNNGMKEARLQNSAALAEIYANSYKEQLDLALQGFQYKNTLLIEKVNTKKETKDRYYNHYWNEIQQINTENSIAEQIRQYNETKALQEKQLAEQKRQFDAEMAFSREQYEYPKAQANKSSSGGSSGGSGGNDSPKIIKDNSGSSEVANMVKKATSAVSKATTKTALTAKMLTAKIPKTLTYDSANAFIKNNGLGTGGQRILTAQEWNDAKKKGEQSSELEYSSYKDYLEAYLNWRISES
jgi:hypothetical protein